MIQARIAEPTLRSQIFGSHGGIHGEKTPSQVMMSLVSIKILVKPKEWSGGGRFSEKIKKVFN
jgi:hypothetical protein